MGNICCCCGSSHSPPERLPSLKGSTNSKITRYPQSNLNQYPEIRKITPTVPTPPIIMKPPTKQLSQTPIKPRIVVALYGYDARDSQDLSFKKGDRMELLNDTDPDWLFVEHQLTKLQGYVPGNYVAAELSVESEDWFFENISRKEAEKLLLGEETQSRGTFLIRPSEHNPNGYSLSVKDWEDHRGYHVKHYKIKPLDNGGFYISTNKTFESLPELVLAYSKNAFGLCHVLSKPCHKPQPNLWDLAPTYRDKWEIPREEIQLDKRLGRGNFGEVYYGKWKNQCEVAVKTLREGTMSTQAFLQEAAIMKKFRHKRLVQLFGVCSTTQPIYIIQEYMCNGSLLNYLTSDAGKSLGIDDFIYIAFQVANGMAYLEEHNFIHRDLAARNVLLGENNIAKICDFGLARIITESEYCAKGGKFPIKWTAPEAIMEGIFTIKSDVWSFGILLMELFTYGEPPYKGMPVQVVIELVNDGYKMPKPKDYHVPDVIYDLMRKCWNKDPKTRPSFCKLADAFEKMEVNANKQSINQRTVMAYEEHTFQES